MSTLTITVKNNTPGLEKLLERLSPRGRYQLNLDIAEELLNLTRERFQSGTDPYGDQWKALSPKTLNKKVREGRLRSDYGSKPLRVTNTLMNSFNRRLTNADAAVVSTPIEYAKYHQSDQPRRFLPQRLFFPTRSRGLPESYWAPIREVIEGHLDV